MTTGRIDGKSTTYLELSNKQLNKQNRGDDSYNSKLTQQQMKPSERLTRDSNLEAQTQQVDSVNKQMTKPRT